MKQPSGLPIPADVIAQGKGKTVLVTIPAPSPAKNENIYHELTVILMNRLLWEA